MMNNKIGIWDKNKYDKILTSPSKRFRSWSSELNKDSSLGISIVVFGIEAILQKNAVFSHTLGILQKNQLLTLIQYFTQSTVFINLQKLTVLDYSNLPKSALKTSSGV